MLDDIFISVHFQSQNILDLLGDLGGPTPVIPTNPQSVKPVTGGNDILDLLGDVSNVSTIPPSM